MLWLPIACFVVGIGYLSRNCACILIFVQIVCTSVYVAECSIFGKEPCSWFTLISLFKMYFFVVLFISRFCFEDWFFVLIAQFSGHCLLLLLLL